MRVQNGEKEKQATWRLCSSPTMTHPTGKGYVEDSGLTGAHGS